MSIDIRHFFGTEPLPEEKDAPLLKAREKKQQQARNFEYLNLISELLEQKKITQAEFGQLVHLREIHGGIAGGEALIPLFKKVRETNGAKKIMKKMFPSLMRHGNLISSEQVLNQVGEEFPYTEEQLEGVTRLVEFIYSADRYTYGLYGFAGSGKTTVITQMLGALLKHGWLKSVAFTAPTNKAVGVMKAKLHYLLHQLALDYPQLEIDEHPTLNQLISQLERVGINLDFLTIHKLLDYQNDFGVKGERVFVKGEKVRLPQYDLVVVDECSMIPVQIIIDLYEEVHKQAKKKQKRIPKLIFVGDPAQLPPVNETVSIIFSQNQKDFHLKRHRGLFSDDAYDEEGYFVGKQTPEQIQDRLDRLAHWVQDQPHHLMTGVVRAKDAQVVGLCQDVRQWVSGEIAHPTPRDFLGEFVKTYRYRHDQIPEKNRWLQRFLNIIKKPEGSGIMLTWTNQRCDRYNELIRQSLFHKEKLKRFEVGDLLILNNFYNLKEAPQPGEPKKKSKKDEETVRFYTSEQIRVLEVHTIIRSVTAFDAKLSQRVQKMKNILAIHNKYQKAIQQINKETKRAYHSWKLKIQRLSQGAPDEETHEIYVPKKKAQKQLSLDREIASHRIRDLRRFFKKSYKEQMMQIDLEIIKPLWRQWNEIFIEPFAEVNYGFCTTVHKSQGSTYYDVFVDANDITRNEVVNEAKRCLYTALTRASHSVHMLV